MAVGPPRNTHGSKRALCLALASIGHLACGPNPQVTTRTVTVYVPQACAADSHAYVEFDALGDFEPSPLGGGHLLGNLGEPLPEIDSAARMIVARATDNGRTWSAVAAMPPTGPVDALLLPMLTSCALSTHVDVAADRMIVPIAGEQALVVGGAGSPVPSTFVADLRTGAIERASIGLLPPRVRASVTAFGDGALVAGGIGDGIVLSNAVSYEPSLHGFDPQRSIPIGSARADAGAVVLTTGETLLVGGVGADGKTPLASMIVVDPVTRTARTERVAQLAVARRAPNALRLVSGEILVAGGFDANNDPVPTLEWFAPDVSGTSKRSRDLVTSAARAFLPLAGGGALAVIAPPSSAPPGFQNTWVINADGALEAAAPVQGLLTAPVLFRGPAGAPVLWTGDRWLRWQPWSGAFAALDVLDSVPANVGEATGSTDDGLALWIAADTPAVTALRFDVRTEYSPLMRALLIDDASETAPDRLPSAGVLAFDPSLGLVLGPGASTFVTDRTYADVAIDVEAPTGEPALVVLRDELGTELEVGGALCPGVLAAMAAPVHVTRKGASVTWSVAGGTSGTCSSAVGKDRRVAVGVRAPAAAARSIVRNLRLVRLRGS
jgi:hypothetical protein